MYLEAREPWRAIKVDRDLAAMTLRTALGLVRLSGHLSSAFIPTSSAQLLAVLPDASALSGVDPGLASSIGELVPSSRLEAPELLFRKIADEDLEAWINRFGGPA